MKVFAALHMSPLGTNPTFDYVRCNVRFRGQDRT
jgi:hypothetical protein